MKLRQIRLAANFQGRQVAKELKIIDPRIDAPLYSKMESGLCLPTPEQFKLLCRLFGVDPDSVYTKQDVDLGIGSHKLPRLPKEHPVPDVYKLTVRLPLTLASGLSAKLKRNGYPSITAYICACIRQLH